MEGKLSPQVAVCLQESLYLPVDPWGEGMILCILINFCLSLLCLHVACFRHKDTAFLVFLSPWTTLSFLWCCRVTSAGVCVPFWSPLGPSQCQHVMKGLSDCPFHTHAIFFALICGLEWFAVPQGLTDAPCVSNLMAQPGWFLTHSDETPALMSLSLVLIHSSPRARLCSH